MINSAESEPESIIETSEERRERFLLEFEKPFKCEKCNERFKKKVSKRTQGRDSFVLTELL